MPGQLRQGQHEPIVAPQDGKAPAWVVRCLETGCGYAHDAHGATPEAAAESVRAQHTPGHALSVERARYEEPRWGKDGNLKHPHYFH